jgi:hypothetical protein
MSTLLDLDSPELTDEVRERLRKILREYACPPTHEGWRMLALILLTRQKNSEFQPMKDQLSGTKNYGALLSMVQLMRKKPGLSAVDAANEVANDPRIRRHNVRSKTLQNQFAKWRDKRSSELQLKPMPAWQRYEALWNALTSAGLKLEESYQDEPYYEEFPPVLK